MSKLPKNQQGLSPVIIVLLIAGVLAIIGFVGYRAYTTNKEQSKQTIINNKSQTAQKSAQNDPTANWASYQNDPGQYSLKYEPAWNTLICDSSPNTVYIAPNQAEQAICNSDKGAPIAATSAAGDQRQIDSTDYSSMGQNVVKSDVTLNGVAGKKVSYTTAGDEFIPAGTKFVIYEFFTNGRTYTITYTQNPGGADLLATFELTVNNTFRFR